MKPEEIRQKRDQEERTVTEMIRLYCHHNHHERTDQNGLCSECAQLAQYAVSRSEQCPFMETKTFCSACKVHCYSPEMREKIRKVMRYSGPRMLFYHPVMAVHHLMVMMESKKEGNDHD